MPSLATVATLVGVVSSALGAATPGTPTEWHWIEPPRAIAIHADQTRAHLGGATQQPHISHYAEDGRQTHTTTLGITTVCCDDLWTHDDSVCYAGFGVDREGPVAVLGCNEPLHRIRPRNLSRSPARWFPANHDPPTGVLLQTTTDTATVRELTTDGEWREWRFRFAGHPQFLIRGSADLTAIGDTYVLLMVAPRLGAGTGPLVQRSLHADGSVTERELPINASEVAIAADADGRLVVLAVDDTRQLRMWRDPASEPGGEWTVISTPGARRAARPRLTNVGTHLVAAWYEGTEEDTYRIFASSLSSSPPAHGVPIGVPIRTHGVPDRTLLLHQWDENAFAVASTLGHDRPVVVTLKDLEQARKLSSVRAALDLVASAFRIPLL